MSLFMCNPSQKPQQTKHCIFRGIGNCRDQVSHIICNAHSEMFGLIHKTATYYNGENDSWTKIVTYATSSNNLNIPLFLDSNRKILMRDIRAFSINVCNNFPSIRASVDELVSRIACMMGVNWASGQSCGFKNWFDDVNSAIIIRNSTGNVQYFKHLPPLHKALFYYINASNIKNIKSDVETNLLANLSLTHNDSTDTFTFVIINKKLILKYTDKPDGVWTPLVLDGIREISQNVEDLTFTPIDDSYLGVC